MIISSVSQGKKAEYSVSGTILTVGTVMINLQERQQSVENVIDVCLDYQLQNMVEGLGAWHVATIVVPPRRWTLVPTGETDEQGNEIMAEQDLPLDMDRVQLRLWGLPHDYDPNNLTQSNEEVI